MDAACALIWEYSYNAVTIDAICDRAAVKKGSFYYFFTSKSDLAMTALDAWWVGRKEVLEKIFRPETPPLERLRQYLDFIALRQTETYERTGQVLGCPVFGLGAEISTQDEALRSQIQAILKQIGSHFEGAVRDAQALGLVEAGDPARKAARLLHYFAGVLTQARIENNLEPILQLGDSALELIGARKPSAMPAALRSSPALSL